MIINTLEQLNVTNQGVFSDFRFSFYAIYESDTQIILLQVLRNNDGTYQWFAIGKPIVFKEQFKYIKHALEYMLKDENTIYCVLVDNSSYATLIELLNFVSNIPYLKGIKL